MASSSRVANVTTTVILVPLFTFFLRRDFKMLRQRVLVVLSNRYFELGCLIYYRVAIQLQHYVRGILLQFF